MMTTDEDSKARVLVLVLCGLAGAGKTTLATWLADKAAREHEDLRVRVSRISFDEIEVRPWGEAYDPETWKRSRAEALARVETEALPFNPAVPGERKLVLVDDNMHLRSMRRQIFQIARKHRTDFAILHLRLPLREASARNEARGEARAVPEAVLAKMHASFEAPGESDRIPFERKTVRVDAERRVDVEEVWRAIEDRWGAPVSDRHAPASEMARKLAGQSACAASARHQLDNEMRREVSAAVQEWRLEGVPGEEIAKRVREFGKAKKEAVSRAPRSL